MHRAGVQSMKKFSFVAWLILVANFAQAELYETRLADGSVAYTDRVSSLSQATRHDRKITHELGDGELAGLWRANSSNGDEAQLTLRGDGSFVFDQRSEQTLHRVYMCGTWTAAERALDLEVKAHKRRLQSGITEQSADSFRSQARILAARKDRITLVIDGQQLTFDRRG